MDAPKPSLPPRPTDTSINARSSAMSPPPTTALRDRTRTLSSRADPPASTPPLPRRRSSILSFSSLDDARNSVQSSAGDIIRPGADDVDDESSHWHSSPLAFAILPAIGGLLFHNGTAFVTDVLLLGLAAVFLNWSVRYPWDWYRSTQAVILPSSPLASSLVLETNEEEQASDGQQVPATDSRKDTRLEEGRADAAKRLRKYENLALMSTFVLPALGAYLLHVIRGQLSRPSTGLVSDYNLTIFLLAAEIRPVRQLIKLVTKRTLHLQRVANSVTDPALGPNRNNDILARLDLLEAKLAANDTLAPDASEIQKEEVASLSAELRKRYEPRLDALERAVRRYEKRATTLTLLTEQRLQSLESRLQDALSLAAVAAQSSRPGIVATALNAISKAIAVWLDAFWYSLVWPFKLAEYFFKTVKETLVGPDMKPKRRGEPKSERSRDGKGRDGGSTGRK